MQDSLAEISDTLKQVRQLFCDLTVVGLLTAGEDKIHTLKALYDEFSRIGASHIAGHLQQLLRAIENNHHQSAVLLMRAQASMQLFNRILSLQYATDCLQRGYSPKEHHETAKDAAAIKLPCSEAHLIGLLETLCHSVEDILLTGMTTANKATCDSLQVAFKEASQMRLLRLGGTLRVALEEINRFNHAYEEGVLFSAKRLNFFLNRAWMISHGLKLALQKKEALHWNTLTMNPTSRTLEKLEAITLGVSKKVVKETFCVFEFRLRSVGDNAGIAQGTALIWSAVFQLKKGVGIDVEAFLHLDQKQKFRPFDLIGKHTTLFQDFMLIGDQPPFRISLTDNSRVEHHQDFTDWLSMVSWDRQAAYQKVQAHCPSPFELDIELQEEIFLEEWSITAQSINKEDNMQCYQIEADDLCFQAQVALDDSITQQALLKADKIMHKAILFGLMHYESCQLILQPLALISAEKATQLMISNKKKEAASILRDMTF